MTPGRMRRSAPRGAVRLCVPGGPWSRSVHLNALGLHDSVHALGPAHPVGPGAARARAAAFAAAAAAAVKARAGCARACVRRGGHTLGVLLSYQTSHYAPRDAVLLCGALRGCSSWAGDACLGRATLLPAQHRAYVCVACLSQAGPAGAAPGCRAAHHLARRARAAAQGRQVPRSPALAQRLVLAFEHRVGLHAHAMLQ